MFHISSGYTLWDENDLDIKAIRNDGTPLYSVNASNNLSEKLKVLDVDVSVQLSILSGLIKFDASVEYKEENRSSSQECSVQVRCLYKTAYKEMGMKQLMNIRYPDVARTGHNNSATHFVTKIQYGAGAIFTFKKQFQSTKEEESFNLELNILGENITKIIASGNGNFRRNCRDINSISYDRITCEFHSFGLSLNEACPTTYEEALKFAANFSKVAHQSMAKDVNGEAIGVPCTVWLQPLVTLPGCANAPKLHCDFSTLKQSAECIREWASFLELYVDIERDIEEMMKITDRVFFVDSSQKIRRNQALLIEKDFTKLRCEIKKLKDMIVDVRSGRASIRSFNKQIILIIKGYRDRCSPFLMVSNV